MAQIFTSSYPTISSPSLVAMPAHSKTGVKKEKQADNSVKASAATKAKDAAKKAMKKASKRSNKENDKSSAVTAQQSAKQSQQKNQKTSHQCSTSPDIDALKARSLKARLSICLALQIFPCAGILTHLLYRGCPSQEYQDFEEDLAARRDCW